MQAGDARFRADLTTATLGNPLLKEQSTIIYDPASGQVRPNTPATMAPTAPPNVPTLPAPAPPR